MRVMPIDVPALQVVEEVPHRWCYAAVEQLLRRAFGKDETSQTEIAHNCFVKVARTSTTTDGDLGRMLAYAKRAMAQLTDNSYEDVDQDWLNLRGALDDIVVFSHLDLDRDGLRGLLRECWGEFDRRIFTTVNIACPPTVFDISVEVADGKLVPAANDVHWYVIYGYDYDEAAVTTDEEAKYTYLVYDVHDGVTHLRKAKEFNQTLSEVLTVTL